MIFSFLDDLCLPRNNKLGPDDESIQDFTVNHKREGFCVPGQQLMQAEMFRRDRGLKPSTLRGMGKKQVCVIYEERKREEKRERY